MTAGAPPRSLGRSFLLSLPMLALTAFLLSGGRLPADLPHRAALALTYAAFNACFFLMLRTGKTDRWRAALYISYALLFILSFVSHLVEVRGTMLLSDETAYSGGTPFCHIVIPMTLIPAALTKTIIFPGTMTGTYAAIAAMFVIWIGASLALGRGWCSWGCFFGGLDDGFSRVLGRPVLKGPPGHWVDLPFAILLLVVIWSAASLSPAYCEWLCPFKAVTEFVPVRDWRTLAQAASFLSLFVAFVIVLPLLMKRRAQCALLCPFGAFQSAANWVDPFAVRVDANACVKCRLCVQRCPTFSLTDESLAQGRALRTCLKCGKCVDACPKGAVHFHVKGTGPEAGRETARLLFIYPAFLFLATMAGGTCMDAIAKLIRLVSTGRLF